MHDAAARFHLDTDVRAERIQIEIAQDDGHSRGNGDRAAGGRCHRRVISGRSDDGDGLRNGERSVARRGEDDHLAARIRLGHRCVKCPTGIGHSARSSVIASERHRAAVVLSKSGSSDNRDKQRDSGDAHVSLPLCVRLTSISH